MKMSLSKEEIKIEIEVRKKAIGEFENQIAELEKQLAEPKLLPCRWCGKTPHFARQGSLVLGCDKTCEMFYNEKSQARAWNEMHDTRPARIVEKDGKRFVEFRVLINLGTSDEHKTGKYYVSEYGNVIRNEECFPNRIYNYEDLKIEVK